MLDIILKNNVYFLPGQAFPKWEIIFENNVSKIIAMFKNSPSVSQLLIEYRFINIKYLYFL